MKHLKPFNKLFESNNDLWELITDEEERNGLELEWSQRQREGVSISDMDKNMIRDSINLLYSGYANFNFSLSSSFNGIEIIISNGYKKFLLLIYKDRDEWFLAKEFCYRVSKYTHSNWIQGAYEDMEGRLTYESYYKCDQIEGLTQLLSNRVNSLYNLIIE